jgi:hypothetical protein
VSGGKCRVEAVIAGEISTIVEEFALASGVSGDVAAMRQDRRKSIRPLQYLAESLNHLLVVVKGAIFEVNPAEPVRAAEEDAAGVEGGDGLEFGGRERPDCRVGGEADVAVFPVIASETAEESCHVAGRCFDLQRAEVDQATDDIAGEQNVIVPDVAQAGLHGKRQ